MKDDKVRLIIGGLLHDTGKAIYRGGDDRRNHSLSGYEYLNAEVGLQDRQVLNCVRYHHSSALRGASIAENDLAYIVYLADNIAAAADRRKKETEERGFDINTPLQSVFNILNGNNQGLFYEPGVLKPGEGIPYPSSQIKLFDARFYDEIKQRMTDNLKGMEWTTEYVNSLLQILEANFSYVPSSTAKGELADISLYDHVKLTAAAACCIYDFLEEKGEKNYRSRLFRDGEAFYREEAFLLCSMDISGIQNFIYTITSKNALRTLRARSFYLEIMMEHLIDGLLEKLALSRANLLYSGGGHCYLLLPNTDRVRRMTDAYLQEVNQWFLKQFAASLYIAGAYVPCSGDALQNHPEGSYSGLFRELGSKISAKKLRRYTAAEIREMNRKWAGDYTKECKVCHEVGEADAEGVCSLCRKLEQLSQKVLYGRFFTVLLGDRENGLPLPGGYSLVCDDQEQLTERMKKDPYFVRVYSKNEMFTGMHVATRLWTGDYTTGQTFEEFAAEADGIKRIGILRADVDNLGQAFVSGFKNDKNHNRYETISRTATLSRQLSGFFKLFIRQVLENSAFSIEEDERGKERLATIIYSGGDDVFIVGAWNDVIELAVDLRRSFSRFTQGTLSISAGIGVYEPGYPIHAIARETGEMEERSKGLPGKNAVTIFEDGETHTEKGSKDGISDGTYTWEEFEEEVIGEKYRTLADFLDESDDRGNAFLYHLLELIRNQEKRINFARFVYLLARLEPDEEGEKKEQYRRFSGQMCKWVASEKDCRQLKTAIQLYVYKHREKGEVDNDNQ